MDDYTNRQYGPDSETSSQISAIEHDYTTTTSSVTADVTDRELQNQITTLCAVIAASEYQFLTLLAEFDTRRAWAGIGTRSCAHWLNWRCGMNLGAARERVRVAHALNNLPLISDAFSKGHLSYSKVRAMTRIATPELEKDLMVTAQYGSASHIEKLVRIYRRCETNEELQEERNACNQRHFTRDLSHRWDEQGNLVIKATLPPEQGALLLKALEAATDSLKADDQYDPWQGVTKEPGTQDEKYESGEEVAEYKCVKDVSAETQPWKNKTNEIAERRVARRVDALALIARDWLSQPKHASKNADRYQVVINVDADILANKTRPGDTLEQSVQSCAIDDMHTLPVDTVRRISCDCGVLGVITKDQQPLTISRKSRSIPSAIRRALLRRDKGCTWPGCCATKYVEGHHIQHWANGGETSLENLTTLCSHHHQLVHEGGYTVIREQSGQIAFYDPENRYIDPRQAQPDDVEYRYHVHRMQSAGIDEKSLWSYCGDRMDYDQAIDGLIFQRDKARRAAESARPAGSSP